MSKIFFPSKNIKDKKAKPCTLKVPKFVVKVAIFLTACASDGASVSEWEKYDSSHEDISLGDSTASFKAVMVPVITFANDKPRCFVVCVYIYGVHIVITTGFPSKFEIVEGADKPP